MCRSRVRFPVLAENRITFDIRCELYYSLTVRETDIEWDDDKNEANKR